MWEDGGIQRKGKVPKDVRLSCEGVWGAGVTGWMISFK
jgi:hypothetical protein